MNFRTIALSIIALGGLANVGSAALLGTSVDGSLTFNGGPDNYFNSSNGFVPGGCQNSGLGSSTVTVVDPTVEFCFADTGNTDSADFGDLSLTITDLSGVNGSNQFTMTFLFAPGLITSVTELTDLFPNAQGLTAVLANDVLTVTFDGFGTGGNWSATYSFNDAAGVPEPSTFVMLGAGLLGVRFAAAKRRARV